MIPSRFLFLVEYYWPHPWVFCFSLPAFGFFASKGFWSSPPLSVWPCSLLVPDVNLFFSFLLCRLRRWEWWLFPGSPKVPQVRLFTLGLGFFWRHLFPVPSLFRPGLFQEMIGPFFFLRSPHACDLGCDQFFFLHWTHPPGFCILVFNPSGWRSFPPNTGVPSAFPPLLFRLPVEPSLSMRRPPNLFSFVRLFAVRPSPMCFMFVFSCFPDVSLFFLGVFRDPRKLFTGTHSGFPFWWVLPFTPPPHRLTHSYSGFLPFFFTPYTATILTGVDWDRWAFYVLASLPNFYSI